MQPDQELQRESRERFKLRFRDVSLAIEAARRVVLSLSTREQTGESVFRPVADNLFLLSSVRYLTVGL